jgi:prepilin-type N-terminal cleavage/methylation domain-containing protein/prepilin-type processing-associated H-X9-DG protein
MLHVQPHVRVVRGFTLIELLVVISIISLLVSILLPALASAREAAQVQMCATNARQMAIAGFSYATDHKQFSPPRAYNSVLVTSGYVKGSAGMYCAVLVNSANNWLALRKPGWLYTINTMLSEGGYAGPTSAPVKLDVVARQSLCMFFSDGHHRGSTYAHWNDYTDGQIFGRTDAAWANPPHMGKAMPGINLNLPVSKGFNVAYLDGHVSFIAYQNDGNITAVRANRAYPFNFKRYWGWNAPPPPATPSASDNGWDRAPFTN